MTNLFEAEDITDIYETATTSKYLRLFRTTPFIITFCETVITEFDIHSFIELGLRAVRFKMTNLSVSEKIKQLQMLTKAVKWYCDKYDVSAWPIALTIDITNCMVKTGFVTNMADEKKGINIKVNSIVELTSDTEYWTKCDGHRIFIDDPYTFPSLIPGTEITIDFGGMELICIEQIDEKNIRCKVVTEGILRDTQFVFFRNVRLLKPVLSKKDLEVIEFMKTFQFHVLIINGVRRPSTIRKFRALLKEPPLLIAAICEQEGLDNVEDIIRVSDGILLSREFLYPAIENKYKLVAIQLKVSAKCRQYGKPFYLSGNIMQGTLEGNTAFEGDSTETDLNDITNGVLQRSGFILRKFEDPANLTSSMRNLNDVCKFVEPLTDYDHQFWRLAMEYKLPVNAAEAAVLSTVLLAKVTGSTVIIVPTVSGKTVKQLVHVSGDVIIIAITSSTNVAKQLQLFRGVISIIYDKKALNDWQAEMETRIKFAVNYAIKFAVLKHGSPYVVLRKSYPTSSYCESVSVWSALTEEDLIRLEFTRRKQLKPMRTLCPHDQCQIFNN